jgi:hypothetical protein
MTTAHGLPSNPLHPYYPTDIDIVGYTPNRDSTFTLLVFFSAGLIAILGTSLEITNYVRPPMAQADRLALLWFVLCKVSRSIWTCLEREADDEPSGKPPLLLRGLFCDPLHSDGRRSRYLWTAVERVRPVGFSVLDLGCVCREHRDSHRGQ